MVLLEEENKEADGKGDNNKKEEARVVKKESNVSTTRLRMLLHS